MLAMLVARNATYNAKPATRGLPVSVVKKLRPKSEINLKFRRSPLQSIDGFTIGHGNPWMEATFQSQGSWRQESEQQERMSGELRVREDKFKANLLHTRLEDGTYELSLYVFPRESAS